VKKILIASVALIASLQGADSIGSWFEEGEVKGNVKYYYIETKKDKAGGSHTSAHANSIGGQLSYTTGDWAGFQTGVTFMTTNGFALPNVVDASIIGRDNGVRLEGNPSGTIAQESFSVLGEAYLKYNYKDFTALYGRQVIKTPLIHAKEVRMLPSAVQGAFVEYNMPYGTTLGASYLTHFKQRTSNKFINIVEHALGADTRTVTGSDKGEVIVLDAHYHSDKTAVRVYNYYSDDFMNSLYLDAAYQNKLDSGISYSASAEYINQTSIGHADEYLNNAGSITGGKQIDVDVISAKLGMGYKESKFSVAYSKVFKDDNKHDSLVLPWDGTPLLTNMITSNDLFQSNYGQALQADSLYIGGAQGIKVGYTQTYDFIGLEGFKTVLAYLNVDNSKFEKDQHDYNAVLAYGIGNFSLALKGIWVRNTMSVDKTGAIKAPNDKLTQYRVIANYKF